MNMKKVGCIVNHLEDQHFHSVDRTAEGVHEWYIDSFSSLQKHLPAYNTKPIVGLSSSKVPEKKLLDYFFSATNVGK